MTESIRIPGNHCPTCKSLIDELTSVRGKTSTPTENTFSVCTRCGQILRFDKHLRSQIVTEQDLDEVMKQDLEGFMTLLIAQQIIRRDRGSST